MPAFMDRLFPKDVNEGMADVQQILPTAEILEPEILDNKKCRL